jgi:hypothetical protein
VFETSSSSSFPFDFYWFLLWGFNFGLHEWALVQIEAGGRTRMTFSPAAAAVCVEQIFIS